MSAPVGPPSVARALGVRPAHLDSDRDEANLMASPPGVAQAVERAQRLLLGLPGSRVCLSPSQCRWVGRACHVGSARDGLGSRPEIVGSRPEIVAAAPLLPAPQRRAVEEVPILAGDAS